MKTGILLMLFYFFLPSCTEKTPLMHPTDNKLFVLLKTKDEAAFRSLFPSVAEMQASYKAVIAEHTKMQATTGEDEVLVTLRKAAETDAIESWFSHYVEMFRKTLAKGEERGIRWSKISFDRIEYDTTFSKGVLPQHSTGVLFFNHKNEQFRVNFSEPFTLHRNPKTFGLTFWNLKKAGEPDSDEIETVGIDLQTTEEEEPPPPPHTKKL